MYGTGGGYTESVGSGTVRSPECEERRRSVVGVRGREMSNLRQDRRMKCRKGIIKAQVANRNLEVRGESQAEVVQAPKGIGYFYIASTSSLVLIK